MSLDFDKPPYTNRGVVNTTPIEKQGLIVLRQFLLIDWLQFTIHYDINDFNNPINGYDDYVRVSKYKVEKIFKELFNINSNDIIYEQKGLNGYTDCYSYKNICIYTVSRLDMGINVKMSGQGCRDYENLGLNFINLFKKIKKYIIKYNRIDIAIDDFSNDYFDLKKLSDCIDEHLLVSKFKIYYHVKKGIVIGNEILGDSIQLGSRSSNVQITFYDKLKERHNNNQEVDKNIKYWIRTELRFKNDSAKDVVEKIINTKNFNGLIKGILKNYVNFCDKNYYDKNRSRWLTSKWWDDFCDNVDKLKLTSARYETSITRKKNWLEESTSKSQFMLLLSTLDNIELDNHSSDYILSVLKSGYKRITFKDLELINDYRLKKGLNPLLMEEIIDYVRDLKDIILINDNHYLD